MSNFRLDLLAPLAYFLTFSCYGTHLHGSAKGSVDLHCNHVGSPLVPADVERERYCEARMKERPFSLNIEDRLTVLETLIEAARRNRWTVHSVHVRTSHVHIVIGAEEPAIKLLGYLKARASHRLKLSQVHISRMRFWTHHGSTRYLWTRAALAAANKYVLDQQGDRLAWYSSFGAQSEATGS